MTTIKAPERRRRSIKVRETYRGTRVTISATDYALLAGVAKAARTYLEFADYAIPVGHPLRGLCSAVYALNKGTAQPPVSDGSGS